MNRLIFTLFCVSLAGVLGQHNHNDTDTNIETDLPMCVTMPTMAVCEDFVMPDSMVVEDTMNLCMMMPFMNGCSMRDSCEAKGETDGDCDGFRILKVLCIDMGGMSGCSHYNSMCNTPGSVVAECREEVADVPSTMDTDAMIQDLCASHFMSPCTDYYQCSAGSQTPTTHCDILRIYSDICLSMSGMPDCADHTTMCSTMETDLGYCLGSSYNLPPVMRMYFHTGERDYILFEGWVPEDRSEYVGSWFAIFLLGILLEFLRACRAFFEYISTPPACECAARKGLSGFLFERPFRIRVDFVRALLHLVDVTLSLLLMLVAMTFNVGLFLAVVFGAAVGHFLFGRYFASVAKGPACH